MTDKQQQLFEKVHEITEFCLAHRGVKCFHDWSRERIFCHVGNGTMTKSIFVLRKQGEVNAVAFAHRTTKGVLIGDVIANRKDCKTLFEKAMNQWPDAKRFWTYRWRHGKQVLREVRDIGRFCG